MNGRPNDGVVRVTIIIVICAYMMLGQAMIPSGIGWNPHFNLETFAQNPSDSTRYELRIMSIDGFQLSEPLYFVDAGDLLSDEDVHEGRKLISKLGIALHDGNQELISAYRQALESTYFENFVSADYEIVFIDVNPVEKYSLETFMSERIVSQFSHPLADSLTSEPFGFKISTN